jgi:hypothetical protein
MGSPGMDDSTTTVGEADLPEFERLYRRAFAEFSAVALWNLRPLDRPTPREALLIARPLRVEGTMAARRLAEAIERACRAHL